MTHLLNRSRRRPYRDYTRPLPATLSFTKLAASARRFRREVELSDRLNDLDARFVELGHQCMEVEEEMDLVRRELAAIRRR